MEKFFKDLEFGERSELDIEKIFTEQGFEVEVTRRRDIMDFVISKGGERVHLELKTRRCNHDKYPDTIIGVNKLVHTLENFNKTGDRTYFLFRFDDGLFYVDPLVSQPEFVYKQFRYDRGGFDSKKGWCLYKVEDFIRIN